MQHQPLLTQRKRIDAPKVWTSRSNVMHGAVDRQRLRFSRHQDNSGGETTAGSCIVHPWSPAYRIWWGITALGAIATAVLVPFQIAFQEHPGYLFEGTASIIELILNLIFTLDIVVNFRVAVFQKEVLVVGARKVARLYMKRTFAIDVLAVLPFETVVLLWLGDIGESSTTALYVSLSRLIRFLRLYRLKQLSDMLQYNGRISLLWSTLIRNIAVILFTTHLAACSMYFLARLKDFGEDTWLGNHVSELSGFDRYTRSLWLSIVTFMTVGYGDFASVNSTEMITMMCFMIINIVISSWFIGSVTLLVVKGDETTGKYRDLLATLRQFSELHEFEADFENSLKSQLILEFNNRDIADEQVLKHFPSAIRRKVLRKLYRGPLVDNVIMEGVPQQFVDAFLTSCSVEIFSPGECIVEQGSVLSDLFLIVGGIAEVKMKQDEEQQQPLLEAGSFIGEIGFFTDHPGSVEKILKNLLKAVTNDNSSSSDNFDATPDNLRDEELGYGSVPPTCQSFDSLLSGVGDFEAQREMAVRDLVQMHLRKQLDDQTTRFCFAASRGDTQTMRRMCDQGFDPNNADYDDRTALMIAAMKGNTDVVQLLLSYKADPNRKDMHGSSALYEAVKNAHDGTMEILLRHGATLGTETAGTAASVLCQAVFDGDVPLLRRLLVAGMPVNASDYDQRTAAHIAAAEGNMAAIRVVAEHGADLYLPDRWGNIVQDEAERSRHKELLTFVRESSMGE